MIINLSKQDPNDPQNYMENERSRLSRQKQFLSFADSATRSGKRASRLDKYFSQHPPNGSLLDIFREALDHFKNTNGETPRWLTYEHLEASFVRLQQSGILVVESTKDKFGAKTFTSQVTAQAMAKRRNVRPSELDTLVRQLKSDLGDFLQQPRLTPTPPIHGCRYVPAINKWRVSVYFGGAQRALGCYSFSTAVRLQDVLTFHFSSYRQSASYNTSAGHAAELLTHYPALQTFVTALEKHWLDAGVLCKPGVDKTEERWQSIESQVAVLSSEIAALRQLIEKAP